MKFTIQFKDPKGVYESLADQGIDLNDPPEEVRAMLYKFLAFKEYVTIVFDTVEKTATVI